MTQKNLEKYLLSFTFAIKEFPFGDEFAVFKVKGRMFTMYYFKDDFLRINLKCNPHDAKIYREIYKCVTSGYHMNKKHWNTIIIDGSMKDEILKDMIDESYSLVVQKLSKKEQNEIAKVD